RLSVHRARRYGAACATVTTEVEPDHVETLHPVGNDHLAEEDTPESVDVDRIAALHPSCFGRDLEVTDDRAARQLIRDVLSRQIAHVLRLFPPGSEEISGVEIRSPLLARGQR